MFWSQPPLIGAERRAVESASLRCSEQLATGFKTLTDELPGTGNKVEAMVIAGKGDQLVYSLLNELATSLKKLL